MKKIMWGCGLLIFVVAVILGSVAYFYVPLLQELDEIGHSEASAKMAGLKAVDIPFSEGFSMSFELPQKLQTSRPFEKNMFALGEKERFIADLKDFEPRPGFNKDIEGVTKELRRRNQEKMSALPEEMLVPISDDLLTSLSYRKMKEVSRFWYFSGRLLATTGKTSEAFSLFFGILILAHLGERSDPQGGGLLNAEIMNLFRRWATAGFVEAICSSPTPKNTLIEAISWLDLLEKKMLPFKFAVEGEEAFVRRPQTSHRAGTPLLCGGQKLSRCPSFLDNNPVFEEAMTVLWGPVKSLYGKPYPAIRLDLNKLHVYNEDFQVKRMQPQASHLLPPEKAISTFWAGLMMGNCERIIKNHFQTRCHLRGVQVVLAIHGFQKEFGKFPDSLAEAGKWAGTTLPLDPFTEKPFVFANSSSPMLMSPGLDLVPETDDDQIFLPLPTKTISAKP